MYSYGFCFDFFLAFAMIMELFMDRKNFIELTNKLYKLTLLFPKKEPLRYKIREVADDILSNLVSWESINSLNPGKYAEAKERKEIIFTMENNLEVIHSYFEIAKWQNWVNYFDVLEIQEEYDKIKSHLIEEIKRIEIKEVEDLSTIQTQIKIPTAGPVLNQLEKGGQIMMRKTKLEPRKEKIIKILEKVDRIQVGEINKLFPDVSKRTIRRDFQKLLKQGIIERMGEKNNTFYKIRIS